MSKEILIADPDRVIQEEFDRIFEPTDHHILFTTNDEEALLQGRLFKPDLIIGGKDLCQAVRVDQELENIPFLILLDMFEDFSEKERELLRPNGIISRPLNKDEILSMVSDINHEVKKGTEKMAIFEDDLDWKSLADIGKTGTEKGEKFSMNGLGETEEEIIDLVDVVEEPESRMSIDDFALQQKEEVIGEITPIESWENQGKEEAGFEKEIALPTEEIRMEPEKTSLQVEEEKEIVDKKVSPEDELFEKIELEEILRKMEKLQPSIEKEWPFEKVEKVPEKIILTPQGPDDRYTGLEEFEAALKGEVEEKPAEEELPPLFIQETKPEASVLTTSEEVSEELELQELAEEEFPEIFLEELEGELEKLKEEDLMLAEKGVEVEAETTEEEEISELFGEGIPPQAQMLEETGPLEEIAPAEELGKVEAPGLEIEDIVNIPLVEIPPQEQVFEEAALVEEVAPVEELIKVEVAEPEMAEIPKIPLGEIPPPVMHLDRKMEEVIAKGVQEMMQDFATQIIPEMAEHMIHLTMERIEAMVKEVIPDLAEKAIQEEIQRLQKGEKE
ncbi:MAG: hypothetical protein A2V86_09145 [Deltaproteobacteria bacterium RBG_16_49_23]|nr:MAG: hypothetical protein A2V86_09145 [Deltaproteobacteria bacterium RBG_16_49_23]